jgi:hypothetical protein
VTTYKYLGLKKLRNLEGWNNIIAMAFIVAPPNQCNSPFKHHKCKQQNLMATASQSTEREGVERP